MSGGWIRPWQQHYSSSRAMTSSARRLKLFCYGDTVPDRPLLLPRLDHRREAVSAHKLGIPHLRPQSRGPVRARRDRPISCPSTRGGRTPIPCVRCNSFTKFRDFLTTRMRSTAMPLRPGTTPLRRTARCFAAATGRRISRTSCGNRSRGGAPNAHTRGRPHQATNPSRRPASGAGDRRQAGIRRDLLRPGRRLRGGARATSFPPTRPRSFRARSSRPAAP